MEDIDQNNPAESGYLKDIPPCKKNIMTDLKRKKTITCCNVNTPIQSTRTCSNVNASKVYNPLSCTARAEHTSVNNEEDEQDCAERNSV